MGASYRELVVWQRAVDLSLAVYKLTAKFPPTERFGITDQLRRAGVSVPSNIAEGYGRMSMGEYLQSPGHARGSAFEVQTQLTIAEQLGYGSIEDMRSAAELASEVGRMLNSIVTKLRQAARPSGTTVQR